MTNEMKSVVIDRGKGVRGAILTKTRKGRETRSYLQRNIIGSAKSE